MDEEEELLQAVSELVDRYQQYQFNDVYEYLKNVGDWREEVQQLTSDRPPPNVTRKKEPLESTAVNSSAADPRPSTSADANPASTAVPPDSSDVRIHKNSSVSSTANVATKSTGREEEVPVLVHSAFHQSPVEQVNTTIRSAVSFPGAAEGGGNARVIMSNGTTVTVSVDENAQQQGCSNEVLVLDTALGSHFGSQERPIVIGCDSSSASAGDAKKGSRASKKSTVIEVCLSAKSEAGKDNVLQTRRRPTRIAAERAREKVHIQVLDEQSGGKDEGEGKRRRSRLAKGSNLGPLEKENNVPEKGHMKGSKVHPPDTVPEIIVIDDESTDENKTDDNEDEKFIEMQGSSRSAQPEPNQSKAVESFPTAAGNSPLPENEESRSVSGSGEGTAAGEDDSFEPQPGPSGIRKRRSSQYGPHLDKPELMFVNDEQINYLTLPERETFFMACQVVPTVDPSFVYDLITKESVGDIETVVEYLFRRDYPTIKGRVRRECMEKRRRAYLDEESGTFNIAQFLTIYPDPAGYFEKEREISESYTAHAVAFLARRFDRYDLTFLRKLLDHYKGLLLPTFRILKQHSQELARIRTTHLTPKRLPVKVEYRALADRAKAPDYPDTVDDVFFREVQYCLHENEIKSYIMATAANRQKQLQLAERNGSLKECIICCGDRYLEEDMMRCNKEMHEFCKNCLKQHTDAQIGEGMNWIRCMDSSCTDGRFEISSLQGILPPATFQLLVRRNREEEIRSANIENIESCPFCEFAAVIENSEDRIFRCLNPICLKESCRKCREESHVPLRCEEVEKDFETRKRKFIEESMSEAVIRKCPTCHKKITKETGCNKMTCPCGTFFCYVCNAKLSKTNPYDHFSNEKGGCKQDTPLTDLHEMVAKQAGQEALRLFHEQNPETVDSKTPDIDQLAGLAKKKRKETSQRASGGSPTVAVPPPEALPVPPPPEALPVPPPPEALPVPPPLQVVIAATVAAVGAEAAAIGVGGAVEGLNLPPGFGRGLAGDWLELLSRINGDHWEVEAMQAAAAADAEDAHRAAALEERRNERDNGH